MVLRKLKSRSRAVKKQGRKIIRKLKVDARRTIARIESSKPKRSFSQALRDQKSFNRGLVIDKRRREIAIASRAIKKEEKAVSDIKRRIKSLTPAQLREVSKSRFLDKDVITFARKELRRRVPTRVRKRRRTRRRRGR